MRRLTQSIPSLLLVVLLLGACSAPAPQNTPTAPSSSPTTLPTPKSFSPTPTAVPATASPSPTPKPTVLSVVYFNGRNGHLTSWTEGKGPRQLADAANAEQVRISDDGQVVAYLGGTNSAGAYGIFAVTADGANERLLVGQDYLRNIPPAERIISYDFAPASHMLYFVTDQYDLYRVDAASGSPLPVFGPGKGGFFSFSPDSQWMVLYHPNELVLARSDGSAARVAFQYPPDFQYIGMGPEIIWEADSSGFYMVSASGPQGEPDSTTVWFIPVIGEPVKQMSYAGLYGANLSPDGRKVVYLNFRHEPIDVHVVAPDGKDTIYSYSTHSYPAMKFMGWAPDSKHFLLDLSKDGRLSDPYLCAVGEQPVKLSDTDYAFPVVWVDTGRILFVSSGNLRLQRLGGPSVSLDTVSSSYFDYTFINP